MIRRLCRCASWFDRTGQIDRDAPSHSLRPMGSFDPFGRRLHLMTVTSLRALTRKALAARAKKHQIVGWHEMTKDELVAALAVSYRRQLGRNRNGATTPRRRATDHHDNGASPRDPGRALSGGSRTRRQDRRPLFSRRSLARPKIAQSVDRDRGADRRARFARRPRGPIRAGCTCGGPFPATR